MSIIHAKHTGLPGDGVSAVQFPDWDAAHTVALTVRAAAGVPTGAPTGDELPIAFDTSATTGGLYCWSGSAWVYAAPIPPVLTPG